MQASDGEESPGKLPAADGFHSTPEPTEFTEGSKPGRHEVIREVSC
jgi:hypothetical protein